MSATDNFVQVGDPLPTIYSAEKANGPFDILVTWAEGIRADVTDVIDVAPLIFTYKVYRPLRDDPELFGKVEVSDDRTALVWPGHTDLEISADALEDLTEEVMTCEQFAQFLRDMHWTFDAAAAQLGISRRLVAYYTKERQVPRYIALACKALRSTLVSAEGTSHSSSFIASIPAQGSQPYIRVVK